MTQHVQLLDVGGNVFLVKPSWREFPSFAMQVDTLYNLALEVETMRRLLESGDVSRLSEELDDTCETLQSWVHYVRSYCDRNSIELPVNFERVQGEAPPSR